MFKIYHNSRCRKSRAGLEYLKSKTSNFEIIEYLKNEISTDELKEILKKINLKPSEIVRTQEDYFKKNLKGKSFTDEEWITILLENPKLIQRPIVVAKHKAVIGDPAENIDKVL
jgi:arsenate reductase (glutaredoxin)